MPPGCPHSMSRPPAGLVLCVGGLALLFSLCPHAGGVTWPLPRAEEDSTCTAPFSSHILLKRKKQPGQHSGEVMVETAGKAPAQDGHSGQVRAAGSAQAAEDVGSRLSSCRSQRKAASDAETRMPAQEEDGSGQDSQGRCPLVSVDTGRGTGKRAGGIPPMTRRGVGP